jgi:hypothetical protein
MNIFLVRSTSLDDMGHNDKSVNLLYIYFVRLTSYNNF